MLASSVPLADQMVNPVAQAFVTFGCLFASLVLFAFVARDIRRHGSLVPALMLAGVAASMLMEPLYDNAFRLHWYMQGQWSLYSAFGVSEPVWITLAYLATYGTYAWLIYTKTRDGAGAAKLLPLLGVLFVSMVAFEALFTGWGVYEYYGMNAFRLLGLPVWIELPNLAVSFATGIAALAVERYMRGPARLVAAFMVFPILFPGLTYATSIPILDVINMQSVSPLAAWLAAAVTSLLSLVVIWLTLQALPLLVPGARPYNMPGVAGQPAE